MRDELLPWAGGLMDGEACFSIARRRGSQVTPYYYDGRIVVEMGDAATINRLVDIFDNVGAKRWCERPPSRPILRWEAKSNDALAIVEAILPYLYTKQTEAAMLRDFFFADREHRDAFYQALKLMHERIAQEDT